MVNFHYFNHAMRDDFGNILSPERTFEIANVYRRLDYGWELFTSVPRTSRQAHNRVMRILTEAGYPDPSNHRFTFCFLDDGSFFSLDSDYSTFEHFNFA